AAPTRSAARLLTEPFTPAITRRVPTTTARPSCCPLMICTPHPTRGGWSGARGHGIHLVQALPDPCPALFRLSATGPEAWRVGAGSRFGEADRMRRDRRERPRSPLKILMDCLGLRWG